jgi:hypothetical protein
MLLVVALFTVAVVTWKDAPAATAQETSTTLPTDTANQSVIPLPNSGKAPEASGDRGGWEQLLLFGIMTAGCAFIFGRVLWAGHQRSRANAVPPTEPQGRRGL